MTLTSITDHSLSAADDIIHKHVQPQTVTDHIFQCVAHWDKPVFPAVGLLCLQSHQ